MQCTSRSAPPLILVVGDEYEMNKQEERYLLDRVWYRTADKEDDWSRVSKSPHIFLTNAPLTFGHSQLIIPTDAERESLSESILFQKAASLIVEVLNVFKRVFEGDEALHLNQSFQKLAENTYSYGTYIKTLVLRTSATEAPNTELKVHLVPYFQSNQVECHKRFHRLHSASPDREGGLIGWLGERETQVDKWLVDGFCGSLSLDEIGRYVWKLPELAMQLRQAWPNCIGNKEK